MILTTCAACAAPLGLSLGKKCGRCSTRYCGPACQKQHWDGGHKDLCKQIKKGGGAEQYHADKKTKEAVAVAVEACVADTKGQKCYICLEAVHPHTGEGLVRGCACGDRDGVSSPELGVAHVSCLARQAKILVADAEENNLGAKVVIERFERWHTCSLCEQKYHGVVRCALGWACWKTYLGRPEGNKRRLSAMRLLGSGLSAAGPQEDALVVREAELSMQRRVGASEETLLVVQGNLAVTYRKLGWLEKALRMRHEVYFVRLKINGKEHKETLLAANNYASSFNTLERFKEAKSLLRKTMPVARRVLGENHDTTLRTRWAYAVALCNDPSATLDDLREAIKSLEDLGRIARRVFGGAHPLTTQMEQALRDARAGLAARETPGES
jgi:hypothetical protein